MGKSSIYLFGGWLTPLKNDGVRQLGFGMMTFPYIYIWKTCSKPPTSHDSSNHRLLSSWFRNNHVTYQNIMYIVFNDWWDKSMVVINCHKWPSFLVDDHQESPQTWERSRSSHLHWVIISMSLISIIASYIKHELVYQLFWPSIRFLGLLPSYNQWYHVISVIVTKFSTILPFYRMPRRVSRRAGRRWPSGPCTPP